jgi:hypothetical protein
MARNQLRFVLPMLAGLLSLPAAAAMEWATWTGPSGSTATGTFVGGPSVVLTANFFDITGGVTAGTEYTSSPALPGRPNNTNPSFQRFMTGVLGTGIPAGTAVATLDLGGITVNASTAVGFADFKTNGVAYKLECRDAAGTVLPLNGIVFTKYNLTYNYSLGALNGQIADINSGLDLTVALYGRLGYDFNNDAGGTYSHTGLTTYSNLPAGTRFVTLRAWNDGQEPEGVQAYVGTDSATGVAIADSVGTASDKSLPFGAAELNTTLSGTVTVTNQGTTPVIVALGNDILLSPFAMTNAANCAVTLAAGASCTIGVTFTPNATGARSDTFTLKIDGVEQPPISVSGSGSAVAPPPPADGGGGGSLDIAALALLGSLLLRKRRRHCSA